MSHNNVFWNQLLMRGDSIAAISPGATDAIEQVLAQLATLTEQFDRAFDPADQFEEYVAVNFCQALQRALTPQPTERICRVSVQNQIQRAQPPAASTTTFTTTAQTPANTPASVATSSTATAPATMAPKVSGADAGLRPKKNGKRAKHRKKNPR